MPDSPSEPHSEPTGPSHSHQHRRRRRHKKDKPRSKLAMAALAALILIIAAGVFFVVRPRLARKASTIKAGQQNREATRYISIRARTILIMNSTTTDWGYTKVTVNDRFQANCPGIPSGTPFEIFYKDLRGTGGVFNPGAEKVETVKIEPEGQKAIVWTRPIE